MKMSELRILSSSPMLLVLLSLLLASFIDTTAGQIGVCYGMLIDPRPNPSDVVALFKQQNIQRIRMYFPDPETLNALRGSNIEVVLGVDNTDLNRIASSQTEADTWIRDNVKNYDGVIFRYITVGNEVKPSVENGMMLLQAMQNIEKAVSEAGLPTKVSTVIDMVSITDTYPPSNGRFTDEYKSFLQPVINFLVSKQSPLHVNIYTFFGYRDDANIPLEYALFQSTPVVQDGPYAYHNLFDANLDSVYVALEKLGGGPSHTVVSESGLPTNGGKGGAGTLHVVVSESGWPTNGGQHGTGAGKFQTVVSETGSPTNEAERGTGTENASQYVNSLIQHVKNGTPRRPGEPIETYIFAMFDENKKSSGIENYWGMFLPSLQPKYNVNFN